MIEDDVHPDSAIGRYIKEVNDYRAGIEREREALKKIMIDPESDLFRCMNEAKTYMDKVLPPKKLGMPKNHVGHISLDEKDNWSHRSAGMKCNTCIWFVIKEIEDEKKPHLGRCRKHCPSMNGFVPVYDTDWCGDHRLDENKANYNETT